jgi:hypothetical protein
MMNSPDFEKTVLAWLRPLRSTKPKSSAGGNSLRRTGAGAILSSRLLGASRPRGAGQFRESFCWYYSLLI